MKKLNSLFSATLAPMLLLACTTADVEEQNLADSLDPVEVADTATGDADPALWVVKDEDTTIYLFGTVHVLRPGLTWFDEAVKDAFDASDQLILEVIQPDAAEAQGIFAKYALAGDGKTLRSRLKADDLAQYEKAMALLQFPAASFDPLDPWAAAVTLQLVSLTKAGYQADSGVETQLTAAAKAAGKPLGQVETFDEQLAIFDGFSEQGQVTFLNQTTGSIESTAAELDKLVKFWSAGDEVEVGKIVNEGFTDPQVYNALLTKRNLNWANWIQERLKKPGTIFMAVGAGHLAGKDSVQNKLKKLKIETARVDY